MKCTQLFMLAWCLSVSLAFAEQRPPVLPKSIDKDGFFLGVGGSFNFINTRSDSLATLNATGGFPPLGLFTGSTGNYFNRNEAVAAEGRAGYFRHFRNTSWLWGVDLIYQYSRLKTVEYGIGQIAGDGVLLTHQTTNTTNKVNVGVVQTKVHDTLMLPVYLGYPLQHSYIYAGIGPAAFRIQNHMFVISDMNSGFYIGTLKGFSNSQWIWGGMMQAGVMYDLSPTVFLKLNYTYARTRTYQANHSLTFMPATNGGLNSGAVSFATRQRLATQGVGLSINKLLG